MKIMQGIVQSAKSEQTAIVTVVNRWQHPLYKKFVKHSKNYACHLEKGMKVVQGEVVTIQECRPMSKTKRFIVTGKVEGAKLQVEKIEETMEKVEAKTAEPVVKKAAAKSTVKKVSKKKAK